MAIEVGTPAPSLNEESFGWQLAFREVNDSGGIHGRRVEVKAYDYSGVDDRDSTAIIERHYRNATDAVADDVFALANFGGPAVLEIAELAREQQVPYLFPHSAMVDSRDNRYMFDSFPKYPGEAKMMYRYLARERGIEKIGIVHDQNRYGQDFADWLQQYADEFGYEFVGSVALNTEYPTDLGDQLKSLIDRGVEAVVMALYGAQGKALMQAKETLKWDGHMVAVGPLSDETYLSVPGDMDEGTLGFCHYPDPVSSDTPGVARYRAIVDRYAPGHGYNRYSLYGYVYGRLVIEGLEQAGPELTRDRFIAVMEHIENWDSGGIMPPVTLSAGNHHAQKAGRICELRDGRFRALTDWVVAE
jgi:branched-chain amino acid transport system substrate-binding protein